jgi:hypothetical protein
MVVSDGHGSPLLRFRSRPRARGGHQKVYAPAWTMEIDE